MEYFSNQKISMFVKYLKGLAMDEGGIFTYGHSVYFTAIWYISWLFGIFFPFWYVVSITIWQSWTAPFGNYQSQISKSIERFITTMYYRRFPPI
jgi:hypothetical protein